MEHRLVSPPDRRALCNTTRKSACATCAGTFYPQLPWAVDRCVGRRAQRSCPQIGVRAKAAFVVRRRRRCVVHSRCRQPAQRCATPHDELDLSTAGDRVVGVALVHRIKCERRTGSRPVGGCIAKTLPQQLSTPIRALTRKAEKGLEIAGFCECAETLMTRLVHKFERRGIRWRIVCQRDVAVAARLRKLRTLVLICRDGDCVFSAARWTERGRTQLSTA